MLVYIGKLPPLSDETRHLGPFALILAPTRELAQQIESETRKFATPLGFKCVSIVGGVRCFSLLQLPSSIPILTLFYPSVPLKSNSSIFEKGPRLLLQPQVVSKMLLIATSLSLLNVDTSSWMKQIEWSTSASKWT